MPCTLCMNGYKMRLLYFLYAYTTSRQRTDNTMSIQLILNLAIALAVCALLYVMQQRHVSFTKRVFTGLGLGVLLGAASRRCTGSVPRSSRRPMPGWT
jgi:glucose uptake protein GlcU